MHFTTILWSAVLSVCYHILVEAQTTPDATTVVNALTDITTDVQTINTTAKSIDTATDSLSYILGQGKYKEIENKFNALAAKTNNYLITLVFYDAQSATVTDLNRISYYAVQLGTETQATLVSAASKAGAFGVAPVAGETISVSIANYRVSFNALRDMLEFYNSTHIKPRIATSFNLASSQFNKTISAYKGIKITC